MTFREIYNSIIPLWGEQLDFSDGMLVESGNALKTLQGKAAPAVNFYSPQLSQQWAAAEENVKKEDTFGSLMVWTMYQVFHRHARELFEQETYVLQPAAIEKSEIEAQYFSNLQEASWENELSLYERIIE